MTIHYTEALVHSLTHATYTIMQEMEGNTITIATDDRGHRGLMLGQGDDVRAALAAKLAEDYPA